jgi:hypothetical protein
LEHLVILLLMVERIAQLHLDLISRNGLSFLVRKFENIEYYVALKSNYSTN